MIWLALGLFAWAVMVFIAMAVAGAAGRQWPGDTERFRKR